MVSGVILGGDLIPGVTTAMGGETGFRGSGAIAEKL